MTKPKIILGLLIVLVLAVSSSSAQEFTLTTTSANTISSKASIDMPGLSGNPLAIIVATPLGSTAMLNPHPIGAWYYSGKWNIFNSDHAVMPVGAKYKVQFFTSPGPNQFLHLITQQNLGSEGSYVDNPALNNNPNAQLQILQNHAPDVRPGSALNSFEARAGYSAAAGKWYITNVNGQLLRQGTAYNIVVSSGGGSALPSPFSNPVEGGVRKESCNCVIPPSLPPTGTAGGDLSGTYPSPTVQRLSGKPLSNTAPNTGQVLKWSGMDWAPGDDSVGVSAGGGRAYTAGPGLSLQGTTFNALNTTAIWNASHLAGREITNNAPTTGQVLKWNGTAWAPADDNVGGGNSTATPKSYSGFLPSDYPWAPGEEYEVALPGMSVQITLTKPSMVNVSAFVVMRVDTNCGLAACPSQGTGIYLYRDNTKIMTEEIVGTNGHYQHVLPNYPELLNAGTYTYKVNMKRVWKNSSITFFGSYTIKSYITVQVFPQ